MTFAERVERARRQMKELGVEALALSIGSDLPYLTGYQAMPLERLTMAVVTETDAHLIVPRLEAPRVDQTSVPMKIVPWDETDDPVSMAAEAIGSATTVAIGSETWARFVLDLQSRLPSVTWLDAAEVMQPLRVVKDEDEVKRLEAAAAAADSVMESLAGTRFSGRSERELSEEIGRRLLAAGHQTVEFAIVASGPNGASPHHEPGDRIMEKGDLVVCDFGGSLHGYHSDTTRTFAIGQPSERQREAHAAVAEAQQLAFERVAEGAACSDIDQAARSHLDEAGWGEWFIHRVGHGIGCDVHEHPYLVAGNDTELVAGMTFSIEPGVYLPGEFGVRIEDIVALTESGAVRLNHSPHELVVVS